MTKTALALALLIALAGCSDSTLPESPFAPGVADSGHSTDPLTVAHRLVRAQEYELALQAFSRAALEDGMTPEIMAGMGTANLGLRRLGQAETLLRDAIKAEDAVPETWNNLGVVLMERGKFAEAKPPKPRKSSATPMRSTMAKVTQSAIIYAWPSPSLTRRFMILTQSKNIKSCDAAAGIS